MLLPWMRFQFPHLVGQGISDPPALSGANRQFFANSETYLLVAMMAKRDFAKKALTTIQWIQGEIVINTNRS
jgi:hypothetical protein